MIPWLFAAAVPPSIQLTAGASWLSVLLVSLVSFCIMLICRSWGKTPDSKVYALAIWGIMALLLGMLSKESVKCWPEGGNRAVAIILLALSLWSAWKGTAAASATGCVIYWFILIIYSIIYMEGANEIQFDWLGPIRSDTPALGCIVLLTPVIAIGCLGGSRKDGLKLKYLLLYLFPVLAAILTNGILSPEVSREKENAFYEMTRSLTLLGQAKRFEAILSSASAIGWFGLMSLYLVICAEMAEMIHPQWRKKGMVIAAGAAVIYTVLDLSIPQIPVLILTAVLWVLVPIFTWSIGKIKKS